MTKTTQAIKTLASTTVSQHADWFAKEIKRQHKLNDLRLDEAKLSQEDVVFAAKQLIQPLSYAQAVHALKSNYQPILNRDNVRVIIDAAKADA